MNRAVFSNFISNIRIKCRFNRLFSATITIPTPPSTLLLNQTGNSVLMTLNRPKALNALDIDMIRFIRDLLRSWKENHSIAPGVFLVKKAPEARAFCAGGDAKSIWQSITTAFPNGVPENDVNIGTGRPGNHATDIIRAQYHMNFLVGTSPVPQVSLWDGIVMGGGVGMSVFGKFRVATENTLLAMPEIAIGLFPDVGSSAWLPHLKSGFGNFIGLTGSHLKGADLVYAGIATHFVPSSRLPELEDEILKVSCTNPNSSEEAITDILTKFNVEPTEEFLSQSMLKTNEAVINRVFNRAQSIEAIFQILNAEINDGNAFAQRTLKTLSKLPPKSLKITLEQLTRGRTLDLRQCLEMEFRVMMRCFRSNDCKEGIRALLVEKDNQPKWSPNSIEGVSPSIVQSFFRPLGEFELFEGHNI